MVHLSTSRIFQLAPSRWGSIDPRRKNRIKTTAKRTPEEAWKLADFAHLTSIPDWWKLTPVAKKKHVTKTHKHTHTHRPTSLQISSELFLWKLFSKIIFRHSIFSKVQSPALKTRCQKVQAFTKWFFLDAKSILHHLPQPCPRRSKVWKTNLLPPSRHRTRTISFVPMPPPSQHS